jgi:hypothetical protein
MAGNKEEIERPQEGFERSDVDTWVIGKFAIALVLICTAAMGGLLMFFHYMIVREGPMPPKASTGLHRDAAKMPPAPQLEETPILDLARERAAEDQVLNSYAWIDKQNGIVRLPIDKAIDLLAQRGLPSRPANSFQSASSASVPSESGLGAAMIQPGGPLAGVAK